MSKQENQEDTQSNPQSTLRRTRDAMTRQRGREPTPAPAEKIVPPLTPAEACKGWLDGLK